MALQAAENASTASKGSQESDEMEQLKRKLAEVSHVPVCMPCAYQTGEFGDRPITIVKSSKKLSLQLRNHSPTGKTNCNP